MNTMLLEHAKAYAEKKELIEERASCARFCDLLSLFQTESNEVWDKNGEYEKQIRQMTAFLSQLSQKKENLNDLLERLRHQQEALEAELKHLGYERSSQQLYDCQQQFDEVKQRLDETENRLNTVKSKLTETKYQIEQSECAEIYGQLVQCQGELNAIREKIQEQTQHTDLSDKMNNLAYTIRNTVSQCNEDLSQQTEIQKQRLTEAQQQYETLKQQAQNSERDLKKATADYERAEESLTNAQTETDRAVDRLNLNLCRYLDGSYNRTEINQAQVNQRTEQNRTKEEYERVGQAIRRLQERNDELDKENQDLIRQEYIAEKEKATAQSQLQTYQETEKEAVVLCRRYNLEQAEMFDGGLLEYVNHKISEQKISEVNLMKQYSIVDDEINAAQRGYVHVSKRIIDFLDTLGIGYQTCEHYLSELMQTKISKEQGLTVLREYPSLAYGIILDDREREKLLLLDREIHEWLPSMVPVFSYEQIEQFLNLKGTDFPAVSFYAIDYFRSKEHFLNELNQKKDSLTQQRRLCQERIEHLSEEQIIATQMGQYHTDTAQQLLGKVQDTEDKLKTVQYQIRTLADEKKNNQSQADRLKQQYDTLRDTLYEMKQWFQHFSDLERRLAEENQAAQRKTRAYQKRTDLHRQTDECMARYKESERQCHELTEEIKQNQSRQQEWRQILNEVGTVQQGTLLSGSWRLLLEQYRSLKQQQTSRLADLIANEENCRKRIEEKESKLNGYSLSLEEYADNSYSEEKYRCLKHSAAQLEQQTEELQKAHITVSQVFGQQKAWLESAKQALQKYGGTPLPPQDIKGNYDAREQAVRCRQKELHGEMQTVSESKKYAEMLWSNGSELMESHKKMSPDTAMTLAEDFRTQYKTLKQTLQQSQREFSQTYRHLDDHLKREIQRTATYRYQEIQILKNFEYLLQTNKEFYTLWEHIGQMIDVQKKRISQIETDLKELDKNKSDLCKQCVIQGKRIYDGLKNMNRSSAVTLVKGKNKKQILKMDIPNEVDESVAEHTINAELDKGIREIVALLEQNSTENEMKKVVRRIVSSQNLFRKYVGKDYISVEVYKIDINPQNAKYRTWEQTQVNNSGGEKLILYFALILSLIAYARNDFGEIDDKNYTSVLILDNPFGAISSSHLLQPMFEIAKHFRVQLICLSDLSKTDIFSCFDNTIQAAVRKIKYSSTEMLMHEGNEEIEHGFYRSEQMNFFQ